MFIVLLYIKSCSLLSTAWMYYQYCECISIMSVSVLWECQYYKRASIMSVSVLWVYQYYVCTSITSVPILWVYQYYESVSVISVPVLWVYQYYECIFAVCRVYLTVLMDSDSICVTETITEMELTQLQNAFLIVIFSLLIINIDFANLITLLGVKN
jgi:hypothetical protein